MAILQTTRGRALPMDTPSLGKLVPYQQPDERTRHCHVCRKWTVQICGHKYPGDTNVEHKVTDRGLFHTRGRSVGSQEILSQERNGTCHASEARRLYLRLLYQVWRMGHEALCDARQSFHRGDSCRR